VVPSVSLREDGTLLLDEKYNLPPGRVKVTVQVIFDYKQTNIYKTTISRIDPAWAFSSTHLLLIPSKRTFGLGKMTQWRLR
jgi:hypothetical protein